MGNDKVVALRNPEVPGEVRDALIEVLLEGTQQLLVQTIETEVAEFFAQHWDGRDEGAIRFTSSILPPSKSSCRGSIRMPD